MNHKCKRLQIKTVKHIGQKNVCRSIEAVFPVLPMFSGAQRAQTEVPGARLWVGNPQFGYIS